MWKSLRIVGDEQWIRQYIERGTVVSVTDGSYMREMYPHVSSAAFILECSEGTRRVIVCFSETSTHANAYRGELMGLMAIHLILKAADKVWPGLNGRARIYSDCLGALRKVANLPPHKIPRRCLHANILKNVLVHCTSFSFTLAYSHVKAHQDDHEEFGNLPRPAQLNVYCDSMAKHKIWELPEELPRQRSFPLEPVSIWIGEEKLTSDASKPLRLWVHKQMAEDTFYHLGLMTPHQFQEVAWRQVHDALCEVPRMFQVFACKQVTNIAGVHVNQAKYMRDQDKMCPSCGQEEETCQHVLCCEEEGRVKALNCTIDLLDSWLQKVGTNKTLRHCLVTYAKRRGGSSMENIVWGKGTRFVALARSMDSIGWRRYMEGMVSSEILKIQGVFVDLGNCSLSLDNWAKGLVIKLLEVTHGQWLYRNIQVHDTVSGLKAVERKEELQRENEHQILLCNGNRTTCPHHSPTPSRVILGGVGPPQRVANAGEPPAPTYGNL